MLRSIKKSIETAKSSAKIAGNHTHTLIRTFNVPVPIVYQVVADVARYQEFIPYCTHSFITKRDINNEPSEAGLRVGFQRYDEEFVCDLVCQKNENVLATSVTHSLFHHLHTKWSFEEAGKHMDNPNHLKHCKVSLELSYRFKSPIYHSVSGVFGASVGDLVMHAFEKRVKKQAVKLIDDVD